MMRDFLSSRERSCLFYLAFVLAVCLFAAAPGFGYFYFVREYSVGVSLICGAVVGGFFWTTTNLLVGVVAKLSERMGKSSKPRDSEVEK